MIHTFRFGKYFYEIFRKIFQQGKNTIADRMKCEWLYDIIIIKICIKQLTEISSLTLYR